MTYAYGKDVEELTDITNTNGSDYIMRAGITPYVALGINF